ncbi:tRNA modification GTPase, partial [bacterium]|nr:tRNA modification GTPase [bacterium]
VARRGEFTERALLGGRLDLVQAEAVADIVGARTRRGLEFALGQLEGGLSQRLGELRAEILVFRAEVESLIDFSDEDIGSSTVAAIMDLGHKCCRSVDDLLSDSVVGAAVRDGVSVAIVGRPNVGKSSLLNALLARARAIVTALPGTTRDAIEETVDLDGVPVRLIDTAGWRDSTDPAEVEGVERAKAAAAGADLVLFVIDSSSGTTAADTSVAEDLDRERTLAVLNKIDLIAGDPAGIELNGLPFAEVSALTRDGIPELKRAIAAMLLDGRAVGAAPAVTNVRHINALKQVRAALERAIGLLNDEAPPELAAIDVAEATGALGEITGETTPDDVLRHIFERFCVGK